MNYIIFDIDGTLANTKNVEDKCFMQAFEMTFGLNIENQKWEDLKNVTDWGITEEIIQREENRSPLNEEYNRMIFNFTTLLQTEKSKDHTQFDEVEGAKHFFHLLLEKEEYKLGIATGSWEKSAFIKLEAIGIDPSDICFSNSDYFKSREAITQDVIRQLNAESEESPDRIIYFGDGEWDYKTCNNLGIDFIGIDVLNDGKLKNLGARTVYNNFLEINQILNDLQ